jgi:hypothetical protein
MKLGEMLVRDGRLTEAQLAGAVAQQQRTGGRFGTVLFEMGYIDLDALTVYLGLELAIPIATGAMLERAKRAAVQLLTPEQAFRYKCVPLIVQHRQLIAAIDEPHDLDTLDALSHLTGYRIIPRVAAEVRIYYYIERFYGIERPARFRALGDTPRGDAPPSSSLPAPPLPGLPPVAARPVVAPRPAQPLRYGRAPTPLPVDLAEDLTLEASDMLEEITADGTAVAETAPVTAPRPAGQPVPEGSTTQRIWVPIPAARAIEAIDAATDRSAIADALLGFATTLFDVAVLFIVRDSFAFGWKAVGDDIDLGRVECALIPLEASSIFQQALARRRRRLPRSTHAVGDRLVLVQGAAGHRAQRRHHRGGRDPQARRQPALRPPGRPPAAGRRRPGRARRGQRRRGRWLRAADRRRQAQGRLSRERLVASRI